MARNLLVMGPVTLGDAAVYLSMTPENASSQPGYAAGLMMGPALLGFISDKTTVQTAMVANAVVLLLVVAVFGLTADETRHKPEAIASPQPKKLATA